MWLILGIIIVLAIVMSFKPDRSQTYFRDNSNPYTSKSPLTTTEVTFYRLLVAALPEYIVLPQVQLSSFIKVDRSITGPNNFYSYFNPIAQQSVDYLLCNSDFSIVAAIELDDRYHASAEAQARDIKKTDSPSSQVVDLAFFNSSLGGGISIDDFQAGLNLLSSDGPQLYVGTETSPVFKLGTFALTQYHGSGNYSLTIQEVAPVPEPAVCFMLLCGLMLIFLIKKKAFHDLSF